MKSKYDMLLQIGLLLKTYPDLTGNWEQDKEKFIKRENEKYTKEMEKQSRKRMDT